MTNWRSWAVGAALAVSTFAAGACGAGSSDGTGGEGASASSANAQGGGFGGFGQGGEPMGPTIVIDPPSFDLTITNGVIVTQALTATLLGEDVTSQVQWSFEKPVMGDVNNAIFTPTGTAGGTGLVRAKLGNAKGTAVANVYVTKIVNTGNLPQATIDALDNPQGGADPSMALVYPLDQTVFPLDVLGPEMMWNGAGPSDAYKLHIKEKFYEYTEYFSGAAPGRHLMPEADWTNITVSGSGAQSDPVGVSLNRFTGAQAHQPVSQTWRVAPGKLKGAIYYWELPDQCGNGNGRILKIRPNSETAEEFYQPNGCWGCHTVSRDGAKMMATLENGTPFPQVTIDLAADPAVAGTITQGNGLGGTFSAFNDKGDRIVVSNDQGGSPSLDKILRIVDGNDGTVLNPNAMGNACGEPAWSPDGKKLAAICGLSGFGWAFDHTGGYLATADVAADGFTVSNVQTIVPQAGAQGRPAYPSFSPGNEWIAFGRPTAGSRSTGDGNLWLVGQDGQNLKELTIASSENRSFNPVFAPLRAGGYYWLVYISRRDYGNRLVGANRQQLWVTAITDPPSAADPSNPPFYIRGQEDCGKSENAYMALEPCKALGEDCTSGVDCCGGNCIKDPTTMQYVCGVPGDCAEDGNACETSADCCNAPQSQCVDGFCQPPIPQ